jgi:plasmid stability protein
MVRKLDPELVSALKRRAAEHGRSMEAEHREILREALMPGRKTFWDQVDAFRKELRLPGDVDTTAMIREDRDSR